MSTLSHDQRQMASTSRHSRHLVSGHDSRRNCQGWTSHLRRFSSTLCASTRRPPPSINRMASSSPCRCQWFRAITDRCTIRESKGCCCIVAATQVSLQASQKRDSRNLRWAHLPAGLPPSVLVVSQQIFRDVLHRLPVARPWTCPQRRVAASQACRKPGWPHMQQASAKKAIEASMKLQTHQVSCAPPCA